MMRHLPSLLDCLHRRQPRENLQGGAFALCGRSASNTRPCMPSLIMCSIVARSVSFSFDRRVLRAHEGVADFGRFDMIAPPEPDRLTLQRKQSTCGRRGGNLPIGRRQVLAGAILDGLANLCGN